jgi:hypothetical protein
LQRPEAKRLVQIADREMARIEPTQHQLGREAQVGGGHQHPDRRIGLAAAHRPKGQGQDHQEEQKGCQSEPQNRITQQISQRVENQWLEDTFPQFDV